MKNCYIKSINLFKALSENAKFSFISNLIHYYNKENLQFFCKEQKNFYLEVINEGWNTIRNFGIFLARSHFSMFNFSTDQYNEIISCLYITYRNEIPKYDKTKGKPTTFFYYRFRTAIQKYINSTFNSPSNYYRRKLKIIDSAIIHLQSLNITPNIEELSKITHLSPKTIKHAFEQRIYHQPTTLDKAYRINNYYENPETIFMHKQKFKKIYYLLQKLHLYKEEFQPIFFSNEFINVYEEFISYMEELDFS